MLLIFIGSPPTFWAVRNAVGQRAVFLACKKTLSFTEHSLVSAKLADFPIYLNACALT
jgi:hypothetical protein